MSDYLVHPFDEKFDNEVDIKSYLGGKGAGLNAMFGMGVPVPPGFTIPTTYCSSMQSRDTLPGQLKGKIHSALASV
jgi:pyruvate,orthophosphate dikinase